MTFLRCLVRQLIRDRTFSIVAVLTLALGIGSITAIFTLIDAHDVERLPYAAPEELVLLWETEPGTREESSVAPGNVTDWRRELSTVEELRAFNVDLPTVAGIGPARRVTAAVVEPGFFSLLGVDAVRGRTFVEDDRTSDGWVARVRHVFGLDWLGGGRDVLDTTIEIDGEIHRVVGVLPENYRHPEPGTFREPMHLVRPLRLPPEWASSREFHFLRVLARRGPSASLDELRAEADALGQRLAEAFPETNGKTTILARPLADQLFREYRPALGVLGWAAGFVLLIVCANLANLMLMRGQRRTREMAIRSALGSGRLRLVGHLLAEAAVLGVAGGVLGYLLVRIGADGLAGLQGRYLSPVAEVSAGGRALLFTLLAAGISVLLFGLL
ncbi:MAG: ABC transporter permease, partial [Thermoanaerobaculia bacterium]|nr:ABC transporter permease [Thermoanaerobaculia bacterium]